MLEIVTLDLGKQNARKRNARTRFTWNGRYAIATRLFHHMQKKRQTAAAEHLTNPESEPDLTPATAAARGIGLDFGRNRTCISGRFPPRIRILSRSPGRVT